MARRLKAAFRAGIFGAGWKDAGASVLLVVAVYLTNEIYALLNHGPAVLNLQTPIDRALPLVPVFVIPYDSLNLYVYLSLILFLLFRNRLFQSAALSMIGAWLVSYAFYFFLQTEVARPVVMGNDLFSRMLREVYAGDKPYNDFPSLHTSISTILALHWLRFDRRAGRPLSVWTALIVASTLLVKQHYIADLVAGLLLAFGMARLFTRLLLGKKKESVVA